MSKDIQPLLLGDISSDESSNESNSLQPSNKNVTYYGLNSNSNLKVQYLSENQKKFKEEFVSGLGQKSIPWQIYLSRALSAWGDRIWDFALGIFMNKIAPDSLRLVAIQGFIINISVIIFGSFIGNWIDRNKRLLAAQLLLGIQNIAVALACAVLVIHFMVLGEQVNQVINSFTRYLRTLYDNKTLQVLINGNFF